MRCLPPLLVALLVACGPPAQSWPEDEVTICLLVPGQEPVVPGVLDGMRLALDEVRSWPGDVRWLELQTGGTAAGALEAFYACQHRGGALAVGPVDPGPVRTLLPVAAGHEVVLLVPRLAGPMHAQPANVFGVEPPIDRTGLALAAGIQGVGHTRVAVLRAPGDFGGSVVSGLGFEPELDVTQRGTSGAAWVPPARAAGAEGLESLVLVGPGFVTAAVAGLLAEPAMAELHLWLVDWGMQEEALSRLPSGAASRVHAVASSPLSSEFVRRFSERYGRQPGSAAGAGYDAVRRAAAAGIAVGPAGWEELAVWLRSNPDPDSAFGRSTFVRRDGLMVSEAAWPIPYVVASGPSGPYFLPAPDQPDQGPRYDAPSPGGVAP